MRYSAWRTPFQTPSQHPATTRSFTKSCRWACCNAIVPIIGDPQTREALVVDPGDEADKILAILAKHRLTVKAIVSTHAHIDHVGGLRKMQQVTGAPVLMHGDDMELYRHLDVQAAWIGLRAPDPAEVDKLLREGDTLRWGRFEASVLHTPGHTPGSISLYLAPQKNDQCSPAMPPGSSPETRFSPEASAAPTFGAARSSRFCARFIRS